ncbi:hypothetical protein K450DRAFT_231427 [Umbelopsis ramanniana AG]|uniref:Uncharacterized protein n=1 Tax=Umbelopsis ramanniana AG TaxID=1314678 RepID=A0AAD5HG74_UMBRA|nr:uncharacterized protein K450DRAFT_231427 [Umbelopsis ramanniana AG]KAI8581461.1 hypothetical protein K450DRAFT_231427 [Umbelopsis ramanniana AG]
MVAKPVGICLPNGMLKRFIPSARVILFVVGCRTVKALKRCRLVPRYFPFWEIGAVAEDPMWNHEKRQNLDVSSLRHPTHHDSLKVIATPCSIQTKHREWMLFEKVMVPVQLPQFPNHGPCALEPHGPSTHGWMLDKWTLQLPIPCFAFPIVEDGRCHWVYST